MTSLRSGPRLLRDLLTGIETFDAGLWFACEQHVGPSRALEVLLRGPIPIARRIAGAWSRRWRRRRGGAGETARRR